MVNSRCIVLLTTNPKDTDMTTLTKINLTEITLQDVLKNLFAHQYFYKDIKETYKVGEIAAAIGQLRYIYNIPDADMENAAQEAQEENEDARPHPNDRLEP